MMASSRKDDQYSAAYLADYGFEAELVRRRQRVAIEALDRTAARTVIEVGCGVTSLAQAFMHDGRSVTDWIIVEPSEAFRKAAAKQCRGLPVRIIAGRFETEAPYLGAQADAIIMSGVLNEVPRPKRLLDAARETLAPGGLVHASVPNARSMHRRLARAMGLIAREDAPSKRNVALGQATIFDRRRLRDLARRAGFVVADAGGYFVKPFTHAQMAKITETIGDDILDGLDELGRELPELAAEIYVNLRIP